VGNPYQFYRGKGHSDTIRCSVMVQGVIITGSEDSSILAWSLEERTQEESEKVAYGMQKSRNNKEERFFAPY
jgi:hypothetical protein